MLAAAAAFLEAYRRQAVAGELGELLSLSGARVHPSDVGPPSNAEQAAHELQSLLGRGEPGPVVRRYPAEPPQRFAIADSAL